jgi:hypothetical protein
MSVVAKELSAGCFLQVMKGKAADAVSLLTIVFPTLNFAIREENDNTFIRATGNPDEIKKLRIVLTTLSVVA